MHLKRSSVELSAMKSIQLGNINIKRIVEMESSIFHPGDFFDLALPAAIDPHREWLEPRALTVDTGHMIMPVQSYLVQTRHHTILIDTCVGCNKSNHGIPDWNDLRDEQWLRNLENAGVSPTDIDYVFCSHLHLDHCGWNTRLANGRWIPTFPNAKYILATEEYAACEQEGGSVFNESVLPIMEAGQAVLVDSDYALDDEVWLTPSPGHTPGHVSINLASRGNKAVMTGDLIHTPLQLVYPDWSPNFDHDPVLSARTRWHALDHHCETDTLILTAHFPSPSIGHVVSHSGRAFDFNYQS